MLWELLDAWPDLDDDDADAVVAILLPKLQRRSGLDVFTFREVVSAMLPSLAPPARCSDPAICDEAKPGQILISPRVLMKVENAVKVEPVGEFELKGIRRPLAAYNVVGALS